MKKLFLLTFIICFMQIIGYSQFSINVIQEMDVYDEKTSSVSVVHSDGYIYNFQSSITNIYLMKINANNFSPTTTKIKITPGSNFITLKGAFEDAQGNIILYGQEYYSNSYYGLIYKISPSTMTIINKSRISVNSIDYGCYGEILNTSNNWENAYAFITSNGKILISNDQLTLNTNQYFIQNAKATQISWNSNEKKFICSGFTEIYNNTTTNLPFLIVFDCKASYTSGWYNYYKIVFEDVNVRLNSGKVVHSYDNNNITLIQSYKYIGSNQSLLQKININVQYSIPYTFSVLSNTRSNFPLGLHSISDMKKNLSNNQLTILGKYTNTNNVVCDFFLNPNNSTFYYVNDVYLNLSTLNYNQFDETGTNLMNATGTYKTINNVTLLGAILYEHYRFKTLCEIQGSFNKSTSPITTLGIISDSYLSSPTYTSPNPSVYSLNNIGVKGICGEYHSGLSDKSFDKTIKVNNEINIILLESKVFILQGFIGSIQCNIYDMIGKRVYSVTTENDLNNSIPTLTAGIYILKTLDNHGNEKSIKFFID